MSEFIGSVPAHRSSLEETMANIDGRARISLVSKSDIRYVASHGMQKKSHLLTARAQLRRHPARDQLRRVYRRARECPVLRHRGSQRRRRQGDRAVVDAIRVHRLQRQRRAGLEDRRAP